MNKREKIILSLTLAVVAYGLLDYFILSKKNTPQISGQLMADAKKATKEFANSSMSQMSKLQLQTNQSGPGVLISKIESPWDNDPFVQPVKQKTKTAPSSPPLDVAGITYSGYMNVGTMSFAVINKVEYRAGETLREYEYKVTKITAQKVVLQKGKKQAVIFLKAE
jgi:hypothetical protein